MAEMTPQEALKVIDKAHDYPCPYGIGGTAWMYIRSCIEKQIPKKPNIEIWVDDEKHKDKVRLATKNDVLTKGNHDIINRCPNCNEWVVKSYKHCKDCGQALDWSGTE